MVDAGAFGQLRPGSVLIGKYEILRKIGRGGFGLVYEARHLGLGTGVAVKVLNAEARQNPKTVARFRQEAWTSARIASENVVRVTDIDVLEDGTPFLVMELLVGRDLDRELKQRGRLPPREAVDYLLQAATGIREAHRQGVVHRDLKTSNLFLVDDSGGRRVKVLDFGLSKIAAELGMTATNTALGTPLYASPEQLRSAKAADARSDIWSLGVIAYQMLSGRLPFRGQTVPDLIVQILGSEPTELGQLAPDAPAGLCQAVRRALEKDPARRFKSAEAFVAALSPFGSPNLVASLGSVRNPSASPRGAEPPGPSSTFLDSSQDTPPERRTSRLWTGVALLGVAVLVTLVVGVRFGSHLLAPGTRDRDPSSATAAALSPPAGSPVVGAPSAAAATRAAPSSADAAVAPASSASASVPSTATTTTPAAARPARAPRPTRPTRPAKKRGGPGDLGF